MKNFKNNLLVTVFACILAVASVTCWLKPETAYSDAERRPLTNLGEITAESVANGEFVANIETYTADQFPLRDYFRKIKSFFVYGFLNKSDNNGLFIKNDHVSKLEYPEKPDMAKHATDKLTAIYNTYLKDTDVKAYLSIVPDKNYYLIGTDRYPSINYTEFMKNFAESVPFAENIDITPHLTIDDFYKTDSHWKQENIIPLTKFLANRMDVEISESYTENILDNPFYGVYAGQIALDVAPDTIKYMTNDVINNMSVNYYPMGEAESGDMYDMEKAYGKDPYEMFLSGTMPLITIDNPAAKTDKELILFRDSYGSSIAPILATGYKKVTLVDIRYMNSSMIGSFIDFTNQDVLFMYSTTILNNSLALR